MERSEYNAPNHVAIILDGNGRWAKKRFLPRKAGHVAGSKTVEQICEDAYNLGINYLTVYAFLRKTGSVRPRRWIPSCPFWKNISMRLLNAWSGIR